MTKDNRLLGKFELSGIPPAPRGVPQIEVSFDVDENGILQVGATDKATGKNEKITITNDRGALSQEEIDRMVREAEEFEEEDKKVRERVEARNGLESLAYNLRNQITDEEKLAKKLDEDEKSTIEEAVKEVIEWLDENPSAEKEDYEEKQKELQNKVNPIISKQYQGGEGGEGADAGDDEPVDEEL
eukprot:NODE_377_length_1418_cov_2733.173850_g36_i1.p2 GENE.NODE_377_length_1418_cov_2733.173850_g36_i1~~NODE_377_length_1418_cov_2733.173850_g36_i1.p2  ORF type:complete len:186 (+),score=122.70 NODE_377_length_1418_cov_2733.173850_g36_i1:584-1141(+)